MNSNHIKVLFACAEEPGFKEAIINESSLNSEIVGKALIKLEKQKLICKEKETLKGKEDFFWSTTSKGDKLYSSFKKK